MCICSFYFENPVMSSFFNTFLIHSRSSKYFLKFLNKTQVWLFQERGRTNKTRDCRKAAFTSLKQGGKPTSDKVNSHTSQSSYATSFYRTLCTLLAPGTTGNLHYFMGRKKLHYTGVVNEKANPDLRCNDL